MPDKHGGCANCGEGAGEILVSGLILSELRDKVKSYNAAVCSRCVHMVEMIRKEVAA